MLMNYRRTVFELRANTSIKLLKGLTITIKDGLESSNSSMDVANVSRADMA